MKSTDITNVLSDMWAVPILSYILTTQDTQQQHATTNRYLSRLCELINVVCMPSVDIKTNLNWK